MPRSKRPRHSIQDPDNLFNDPLAAATHLDSLMKVIQRRYGATKEGAADLGSFLIARAEVNFSSTVEHVTLEKRPESQTLAIISPSVGLTKEEEMRVELLNSFGELILKFQKQAYLQIREMLLQILDEEGKRIFLEDFSEYIKEIESGERTKE